MVSRKAVGWLNIMSVLGAVLLIRHALVAIKQEPDVGNVDCQGDSNCDRMVRFLSEWRERNGTEGIYYEKRSFSLVRIHSMYADGHSMDFYCECIPCPGLPVSGPWPTGGSFQTGTCWGDIFIGKHYWAGSYVPWILIFDPEAIQTFKAVALKFQNASEADRRTHLQKCLRDQRWRFDTVPR
jgi:hypothetical protein